MTNNRRRGTTWSACVKPTRINIHKTDENVHTYTDTKTWQSHTECCAQIKIIILWWKCVCVRWFGARDGRTHLRSQKRLSKDWRTVAGRLELCFYFLCSSICMRYGCCVLLIGAERSESESSQQVVCVCTHTNTHCWLVLVVWCVSLGITQSSHCAWHVCVCVCTLYSTYCDWIVTEVLFIFFRSRPPCMFGLQKMNESGKIRKLRVHSR